MDVGPGTSRADDDAMGGEAMSGGDSK